MESSSWSKPHTLVFSGGGVKGLSYIGVFKALVELDLLSNVKKICAVSAGVIFCLLYLVGYTYEELEQIFISKNFEKVKKISIKNFLTDYGLDDGKKLIDWLSVLVESKGFNKRCTFLDLFNKTNIQFDVMTTNLSTYEYGCFNHINTPDFKVLKAIRMAITVPFFFTALNYQEDIHIDGFIVNNYPITQFDNLDGVLGFKIVMKNELDTPIHKINNIVGYMNHVICCYNIHKEKKVNNTKCTVFIDCKDCTDVLNFSISAEKKLELIHIGYTTLKSWLNQLNH